MNTSNLTSTKFKKGEMTSEQYHDYLRSLGHVLKTNEDGSVDIFGLDIDYCNGPSCINCGDAWCHHCQNEVMPCEYEIKDTPK